MKILMPVFVGHCVAVTVVNFVAVKVFGINVAVGVVAAMRGFAAIAVIPAEMVIDVATEVPGGRGTRVRLQ